jgi:hypothetical protein
MKKTLLLTFFLIFINSYSQKYILGKVVSEQNSEIAGVLVININTDEKTYTNNEGNFMIAAKSNDLIRLVKQKFDRISYTIKPEDFQKTITINLQKSTIEIDEVEIKNKLTGNLKDDINKVENKKKTKLNQEISKMNLEKTDLTILLPRAGEFKQQKGEGFSIGTIKDRWDIVDVNQGYLYILGEDYFVEELGLQKEEVAHFIGWITPEEMRTTFKMTADGVRSFIHRHKIPAKVEYGSTYYSKQHIEEIKNGYFVGRDRYYSVEEATKKYNLTNSLVFYYVNHYKLTRVKKQKFIFFRKEEFDRLMEKRFSEDDFIANILFT